MKENNTNSKKEAVEKLSDLILINEHSIKDIIHKIRGVQVILDYDLARIYGYSTKAFNQQVKNNIAKFDSDFMFRLSRDEIIKLSRSKNLTSIQQKGVKGGRSYLPYAFTEQGIYMLMTVLKGELATKQSKALIRTFKMMKDYYLYHNSTYSNIDARINSLDNRLHIVENNMKDAVMKNEIAPFLLTFDRLKDSNEIVFMDGEIIEAKSAYQNIYNQAKTSIYIIDDYISINSLNLLSTIPANVSVIVFSDNVGHYLHKNDIDAFRREFPEIIIKFHKTRGIIHDRFIIIDYDIDSETIFHCGPSSKDAGKSIAGISEFRSEIVSKTMKNVIKHLLNNPPFYA